MREDGSSEPRPLRNRATLAIVMACTGVAQGFGRLGYVVVLPSMVHTFLHSYAAAGTLGVFNVGAYLGGTGLAGYVSLKLSPSSVMKIGLLASIAGMVVIATSSSFLALGLGMILAGSGGAFIWVPAPGVGASAMPVHRRGLAMGLAGAGIGIAITVSSQIARILSGLPGQDPWRLLWAVQAIVSSAVLALALLYLRSPPKQAMPTDRGSRGAVKELFALPGLREVTLAYSAFGMAYALFMTFFVATLERVSHFTIGQASLDYGLSGFISIFGGILAGRISDSIGRTTVMALAFFTTGVAALLVLKSGEPYAAIAAVLFGFSMSAVPNSVAAYLGDLVPARSFATGFAIMTLCFGITQAASTQLGGVLEVWLNSFTLDYVLSSVVAGFGVCCAILAGHKLSLSKQRMSATSI